MSVWGWVAKLLERKGYMILPPSNDSTIVIEGNGGIVFRMGRRKGRLFVTGDRVTWTEKKL